MAKLDGTAAPYAGLLLRRGRSLPLDADGDASRVVRGSETGREEGVCASNRFGWISQVRPFIPESGRSSCTGFHSSRSYVSLLKVREALDYVKSDLKIDRPLLSPKFHTDGVDLFVEELDLLEEKYRHLADNPKMGPFVAPL
jgi:hypothetical protein